MSYKIVVDSCCDLTDEMKNWNNFEVVPLTLQIGDYCILDDSNFNQEDFISRMVSSNVIAKSACPSPQAFASACNGDYDDIYIITITDRLSGCYNSALQGVELYKEEHNDSKNIHVFNSLSTSGVEALMAQKIKHMADSGETFDDIVTAVEKYAIENCKLYFLLESYDMLKGNGRLYNLAANMFEALKVKLIGVARDGKVAIAGKDFIQKRVFIKLADMIAKDTEGCDLSNKQCILSHVCCEDKAEAIKAAIISKTNYTNDNVTIMKASGLNSLYGSDGGVLVAFNY
ncbi:MAG: DegV family protein [Acetobacter sp.]|nr:DegV family protein [Bacteroides sp.]MCM1340216.1 DegV family protein [Acetobacter sp.]MCM1432832.1 DegV family protein [Clostridiales bacterium]